MFVLERRKRLGELAAGVGAIDERHGYLQEPTATITGIATRRRDEEPREPARGEIDRRLRCAGLGEDIGRAGMDGEDPLARQPVEQQRADAGAVQRLAGACAEPRVAGLDAANDICIPRQAGGP